MPASKNDVYLTPVEAADLLKVSDRHLRTLTKAGTVPAVKLAPRTIRYSRDLLLSFGSRPDNCGARTADLKNAGKSA